MTKVADDFNMSDRGMAKLCARHVIPVPPRGYWAKKQAGQKIRKPTLKKLENRGDTIVIYEQIKLSDDIQNIVDQAKQKISPEAVLENYDILPLESLHPSIRSLAKSLRNTKPKSDGVITPKIKNNAGITIGKGSIERTITILHRLAISLETHDLNLQFTPETMKIVKGCDEIHMDFRETIRREKHIPTEAEKKQEAKDEERHQERVRKNGGFNLWFDRKPSYPEYDYIRTGDFYIELKNCWISGARKKWNDGIKQRLELIPNDIALGIIACLEGLRIKREKEEHNEKKKIEAERKWEIKQRWNKREEQRTEFAKSILKTVKEIQDFELLSTNLDQIIHGKNDSEIEKMQSWINENILDLRNEISATTVTEKLKSNNLFPTHDDFEKIDD